MTTRSLLFACVAASLCLVDPSASAAAPKTPTAPKPIPVATAGESAAAAKAKGRFVPPSRPPPAPLSPTKRTTALKASMSAIRAVMPKKQQSNLAETLGKVPATLEMRLTPLTPKLDNGALLRSVTGANVYHGSEASPDGVYYLIGNETDGSWISIKIPTEVGGLYVMDCRAIEYDLGAQESQRFREGAVSIHVDNGDYQNLTTVDGHIVWAFSAARTNSEVSISYFGAYVQADNAHHLAFWGCDIGKAG